MLGLKSESRGISPANSQNKEAPSIRGLLEHEFGKHGFVERGFSPPWKLTLVLIIPSKKGSTKDCSFFSSLEIMPIGNIFHAWRLRFSHLFFMDNSMMASLATNKDGEGAKKKSMYNLKLTSAQVDKLGSVHKPVDGQAGRYSMRDMLLMGTP